MAKQKSRPKPKARAKIEWHCVHKQQSEAERALEQVQIYQEALEKLDKQAKELAECQATLYAKRPDIQGMLEFWRSKLYRELGRDNWLQPNKEGCSFEVKSCR